MNVLFCASEASPFFASGGLADVAGSLPKAIKNRKVALRCVLPLYSDMKAEYKDKLKYLCNFTVPVGWRNQYCGVFSLNHDGVIYYFLDNEYYFKRKGLYGFYDDAERYAFFSRAILEMLFYIDFKAEIIHTNDWQTALVNVYLNMFYRHLQEFASIKTVFTIHNIQYQGHYGTELLEEILSIGKNDAHIVEYDEDVNFMKGAIETADKVTTVSPQYAKEILDPWFAHELDTILREKQYKLCGIINGIDVKSYNPETDKAIAKTFNFKTFKKGKPACKKEIIKMFNLNDDGSPIIAMVTRLVDHKGIDLVRTVAEEIIANGMQLAILGSGDSSYEAFFTELQAKHPGRVGTYIGFVPAVARVFYAGADMFLMPSKSEPCGLSQMVALRYGTIPIVRETGGLKDTVFDCGSLDGNGFTFKSYNAGDMLGACTRANELYKDKKNWDKLVAHAMQCDYSWGASAKKYVDMYKEILQLW